MGLTTDILELLHKYPHGSKLQVEIIRSQERPEYRDKVNTYRYTITIDQDSVEEMVKSHD